MNLLWNILGLSLLSLNDSSNEEHHSRVLFDLVKTVNSVHHVSQLVRFFFVALLLFGRANIVIRLRNDRNQQVKKDDNVEDDAQDKDKEVNIVVTIELDSKFTKGDKE